MENTQSLEQRITDLEIRLAHSEQATDDLTQILRKQEQHIDALQQSLAQMRDRMSRLAETGEASPQDEKPPPHY